MSLEKVEDRQHLHLSLYNLPGDIYDTIAAFLPKNKDLYRFLTLSRLISVSPYILQQRKWVLARGTVFNAGAIAVLVTVVPTTGDELCRLERPLGRRAIFAPRRRALQQNLRHGQRGPQRKLGRATVSPWRGRTMLIVSHEPGRRLRPLGRGRVFTQHRRGALCGLGHRRVHCLPKRPRGRGTVFSNAQCLV
jgi:hypothetical protein